MKKTKAFALEFKKFIMRGNVLDMAIGVIIASAFGAITTSLVNDIFMPVIGWLIGDIDLSQLNITLSPAVVDAAGNVTKEAVVIGIGGFLVTVIDFLLVALVVFIVLKVFTKASSLWTKKEEAEEAAAGPTTEELLSQILEELREKK